MYVVVFLSVQPNSLGRGVDTEDRRVFFYENRLRCRRTMDRLNQLPHTSKKSAFDPIFYVDTLPYLPLLGRGVIRERRSNDNNSQTIPEEYDRG